MHRMNQEILLLTIDHDRLQSDLCFKFQSENPLSGGNVGVLRSLWALGGIELLSLGSRW